MLKRETNSFMADLNRCAASDGWNANPNYARTHVRTQNHTHTHTGSDDATRVVFPMDIRTFSKTSGLDRARNA